MKLDVTYCGGEPSFITNRTTHSETEYRFTVEGTTARLVYARTTDGVDEGDYAINTVKLNHVHDAVLELPFIDRCTVWTKNRTETTMEVDDR